MRAEPWLLSSVVTSLRAAGCVFAEEEAALLIAAASDREQLDGLVEERAGGRPLEYILGSAEFCGLRIQVADGVFVPRRRTGFLVRCAVESLPGQSVAQMPRRDAPVVLDLCCGSGAIGAAIAREVAVELHACDIEPTAVRSARRNLGPLGGRVYEGDLYRPLPAGLRGRIDVLVVNAPYVPTDSLAMMPAEARLYEPQIALDGGADGLAVQRLVIAGAGPWLARGGQLLIETGEDQARRTAEIMHDQGFQSSVRSSDDFYATVVIGRMAHAADHRKA